MTEANEQKIGILGGSFNPVHIGHRILARDAMEAHGLCRVLFVPCARPAHKPESALAHAAHRVAMLERALADNPAFGISHVELDRAGISYAVDTVTALRDAQPDVAWSFIIGADTLQELHTWREISTLVGQCRFITMRRPGQPDPRELHRRIRLPPPWPDQLMDGIFDGHQIDISSTEIRKRVAEARSIRYLVPNGVEAYINEHGLYTRENSRSKPKN